MINKQNAQLVSLDHLCLVTVTGADAFKLLQGQTTCDFNRIDGSYSSLGAFCNHQGRIRGIFRDAKIEDGFALILSHTIADEFIAELKKYAVFFKTDIALDQEYRLYGLLTETDEQTSNSQTQDENGIYIKNQTVETSYYWLTKQQQKADTQTTFNWHKNEILSGLCWVETATYEKLIPHYVKLPDLGGVSFTKGCYTGQEVVARMHYKGKLKHQLKAFSLQTEEMVTLGTLIYQDDKKVGQVIRSTCDSDNNWFVLAELNQTEDSKKFSAQLKNSPILSEEPLHLDLSHKAE